MQRERGRQNRPRTKTAANCSKPKTPTLPNPNNPQTAAHLAHDRDLLEELAELRRVVLDAAEDLDRHVLAAVDAAEEVAKGAGGDLLVKNHLPRVELPVVGLARGGSGRLERGELAGELEEARGRAR